MTPETAFPVSLVAPDNAAGVALNPSSLGTLQNWSLTYSHVAPARGTNQRDRYDGAWFATPLGSMLAVGGGIEFARSRDRGEVDQNGFVLAAALSPSPKVSLGASWHKRSPQGGGPNVDVADLSLSLRPTPRLGISLIARDLAPRSPVLVGRRALELQSAGNLTTDDTRARSVRESIALAFALRPLGDDRALLELAGRSTFDGSLGVRIAGQAKVPQVGRLAASGELSELNGKQIWTLQAGLDVRWGALSVAPAVHTGEHADDVGWSMLADVRGQRRVGLPEPGHVAKIELRGLGPRRMLGAVRAFEQALLDPRVEGVVLLPEGASPGLASAQELRQLINQLEQAGKPVYCFLEAASGSEYYLCAGARRIAVDPAGLVRLMGVSGESLYFGELLRELGLRADFIRIGRYKSAPEQYTNDGSSEATREVRKGVLDGAYRRLVSDLSADRGQSEESVRATIDRGPFTSPEAVRERLVQVAIDKHDLEKDARLVFGPRARFRNPTPRAREPRFGPTDQIGVVMIDGTIIDGDNVDVPLLDVHMSGGHTIAAAIDKLAEDRRIRAIVLRIDSPGGAVMASDQIWRAARRAQAKKPVIASMGEVAASGGYYVASAAHEIWASPSTITGSIGIFYGKLDVAQLAAHIGVGIESESRGAHAGADSLFRPFTDDERAGLADKLRIWYRQFLERVAEGRKLSVERVDELARGRVYNGDQAQANGLIVSLGGLSSALARARQLAGVDADAELVVLPVVPTNLLQLLSGTTSANAGASAADSIPLPLRGLLKRLYPWTLLSGVEPMALYEGPLRLE
ncbi:MAG: Protease [Myxococcaceae bacterium]|nr:Protease [Myxococcaceae bacterium]